MTEEFDYIQEDEPNYKYVPVNRYPKKIIKKARNAGCRWIATDYNGEVYGHVCKPYCEEDGTWLSPAGCYRLCRDGGMNPKESLYEIPEKAKRIYPKWVIKAAKHNGLNWIVTDENGAVYGFQVKPEHDNGVWYGNGRCCLLLVFPKYPLAISVDWQDSLYEVK